MGEWKLDYIPHLRLRLQCLMVNFNCVFAGLVRVTLLITLGGVVC